MVPTTVGKTPEILKSSKVVNPELLNQEFDLVILLFSYNQAKFILSCLKSVLRQHIECRFLLLIHDDASLDESQKIIESFCQRNYKFACAILQQNNLYSRNNCIFRELVEISNGQFYTRIDADDSWIGTSKIQKQFLYLRDNNEVSAVYHDYVFSDIESKSNSVVSTRRVRLWKLLMLNPIGLPTTMFRKSNLSFPSIFDDVVAQDWLTWLMLVQKGKVKKFPTGVAAIYRKHGLNGFAGKRNSNFMSDYRLVHNYYRKKMLKPSSQLSSFLLLCKEVGFALDRKFSNREFFTSLLNVSLKSLAQVKTTKVRNLGNLMSKYDIELIPEGIFPGSPPSKSSASISSLKFKSSKLAVLTGPARFLAFLLQSVRMKVPKRKSIFPSVPSSCESFAQVYLEEKFGIVSLTLPGKCNGDQNSLDPRIFKVKILALLESLWSILWIPIQINVPRDTLLVEYFTSLGLKSYELTDNSLCFMYSEEVLLNGGYF